MTARALVEVIAALVIFLILAGLGLFQVPSEEATIEAGLQAQATALLADLPNPPSIDVSGREITVQGRVESHAVRRQIESRLRGIEGVKEVTARLDVLPEIEDFAFQLSKDAQGVVVSGHVRRADTVAQLAALTGVAEPGVQLAHGQTVEGWDDAVITLAQAAGMMAEADLAFTGEAVQLRGETLWPADLETVQHHLAKVPETVTVSAQVTSRDDGAPFLLVAEKKHRLGVSLHGKLPPDLSPDLLAEPFGGVFQQRLVVGPVDPGYPTLAPAMTGAVNVLAVADEGVAMVTPGTVVLSALRGGAEVDQALDALRDALPKDHLIQVSRQPVIDPQPFRLDLARRDGVVTAKGIVPIELDLDAFTAGLAPADVSDLQQSPYPDVTGWLAGVDVVRRVFDEVIEGAILLEETSVTLDALLQHPDNAAFADTQLATLPQAKDFRRSVELVDDGREMDATLTYAPQTGARIDGVLPADLTSDQVATRLGLQQVAGDRDSDKDMPLPRADAVLAAVGRWLGEAEQLTLTMTPNGLTLDAVLSPGVDMAQIDAAVRAVLAPQDTLRLRLLSAYPANGTERPNVALGTEQVFVAGYWLPKLDFVPSVAECARQSLLAERADPIHFLSGSARLDARSVRGVNALAAVARVCVLDGGLEVQIEGHTDSLGAVAANRAISRERAVVVAVEIAKRGVRSEAMNVVGYGPARPVADNDTEQGRALNRRITLSWRVVGREVQ